MAWFEGFEQQTATLRGLPVTFRRSADWANSRCAGVVSGQALPAGHFIPEEQPEPTAQALADFMR